MKKFKKIKEIKNLEASKLTKKEMYQTNGGMMSRNGTAGTRSVCHIDGTDDADSYYFV
jgi:hypothetical protein